MAGDNPWYDRRYSYDARGNMTGKTVLAAAGTTTETRTVNALNQITQNEVDDGSTITTWTYTWDANGNLATRSDGTEAWTYTFDDDNRLVRVVKVVSGTTTLDLAYTYDSVGRMLTRKLSTDTNPTRFEWDGWDLVREVDPAGVETIYYAPQGEITSFKRGSSVYQVHGDALGSVRKVTDSAGVEVARFGFDAWGNTLVSSGILNGIRNQFVGAFGVITDGGTLLTYMRNRWYDANSSQLISRDVVREANRYRYAAANPVSLVDTDGLQPSDPYADRYPRLPVPQSYAPVATGTHSTDPYIPAWVRNNLDLIKQVSAHYGLPPEVLCATIATELRGGSIARLYQQEKPIPATIVNVAQGEGVSSSSFGPGQVSVAASIEAWGPAGANVSPWSEWLRLHFLGEGYQVGRSAAYLAHLAHRNRQVRQSIRVGPLAPYSASDWARVVSGYNYYGDVSSNQGTWGNDYPQGSYGLEIEARIRACRELFECKK